MKGTISPFDFSKLPKLSRAELLAHRATADFYIDIDAFNSTLQTMLQKVEAPLFSNCALVLKSHAFVRSDHALLDFSEPSTKILGYLGNESTPFAISLEKQSAKKLVHHLLGGDGSSISSFDLTPIEEGVFTFLVTNILHAIKENFLDRYGLSVRLSPLNDFVPESFFLFKSYVLELSFQAELSQELISARVLVEAHPNLISLFQKPVSLRPSLDSAFRQVQTALFPVSAPVGEFSLNANELSALEIDDIVLLDSSGLKLDSNVLSGEVTCNIGDPSFESIRGRLSLSKSGNYSLEVTNRQRGM